MADGEEYVAGSLSAFFDGKPKPSKCDVASNDMLTRETRKQEVKEKKLDNGSRGKPEPPSKQTSRRVQKDQAKKIRSFTTAEENRRTIFIGNLPNTLSEKKIKKIFLEFGPIETLRFRSVVPSNLKMPKRAAAITKQYSEQMHGVNVYIKFINPESAELALSLNGLVIKKHHLRVDACWKKTELDNKRTIFVGNLPFSTHEDQIWSFFEICGSIEAVRIVRDNKTGQGKGIAFVCFKDSASLELALKLNDHIFDERQIRVNRAVNKEYVEVSKSQSKMRGKKLKLLSKLEDSHTLKNKGSLTFMDPAKKHSVSKMIKKKKNKKLKGSGHNKTLMS